MNLHPLIQKLFVLTVLLGMALALQPSHVAAQTPNDPRYPQQTYLETIGIEGAWSVTTGDAGHKIGIIGPGSVLPTHEDLGAKTTIGSRGRYDDGDSDPEDEPLSYDLQSTAGTASAGIAAAITDNSTGIAGANWNAPILSYNPVINKGPLGPDSEPISSLYSVLERVVL